MYLPANTHLRHAVYIIGGIIPADGKELVLYLLAILLTGHIHERREVCQADSLPAIGIGGHLSDDLRSDIAGGGKAVWLLNQRVGDDRPILKHVLQIDQFTVGNGT